MPKRTIIWIVVHTETLSHVRLLANNYSYPCKTSPN